LKYDVTQRWHLTARADSAAVRSEAAQSESSDSASLLAGLEAERHLDTDVFTLSGAREIVPTGQKDLSASQ